MRASQKEKAGSSLLDAAKIVWVIAQKDLLVEYRSREVALSIAGFGLLAVFVFAFSIDIRTETVRVAAGPGVLWIVIAFATVIGLNRSFGMESEQNTLDGLLLAPINRELILLGKALGILLFLFIAELAIVPFFALFFNLPLFSPLMLAVCILSGIGLSLLGTVFAATSVRVRSREVMLPLLLLPAMAPLLLASVEATSILATGGGWSDMRLWLGVAAAFDLVLGGVCIFLFNIVLEE